MIFHDFPAMWLGSKTKVKIAMHMLSGAGPVGERELARAINMSHVAVGKALEEMEKANFLQKTRIGNANVWSVNEKSYAYLCCRDMQFMSKTPPLLHLKNRLETDFGEKCKYVKKAVLFGSVAEGKEKENSDIDIFLLVEKEGDKNLADKKISDVNEGYVELYGNRLSPIILTEKESEKNKALMENIRRGVVIK